MTSAPAPYDPFARGPHPVGVRTFPVTTTHRPLIVEVWYPATADTAGADVDPAQQDRYRVVPFTPRTPQAAVRDAAAASLTNVPLVIFSHGLGGFRQQSTFLTTHLASHGYLVVAPDHPGSTLHDFIGRRRYGLGAVRHAIAAAADARLADVPGLIDVFTSREEGFARLVDATRVGAVGHSFGGWTSIGASSVTSPLRAVVALAPVARGANPAFRGRDPYDACELDWSERPPTMIIAADRDSLCRLPGVEQLHAGLGAGHRLMVIRDTDHFHFMDRISRVHNGIAALLRAGRALHLSRLRLAPMRELLPEQPAHAAIRGATLAHFDAFLKQRAAAAALLAQHLAAETAARGAILALRGGA